MLMKTSYASQAKHSNYFVDEAAQSQRGPGTSPVRSQMEPKEFFGLPNQPHDTYTILYLYILIPYYSNMTCVVA